MTSDPLQLQAHVSVPLSNEEAPKMICIYYLDFSTLTAQVSSLALAHNTLPQQSHWLQFYCPTMLSISSLPLRSTWHGWPIIPSVKIPLLAFLPDITFCWLSSISPPPLSAFLPSVCLHVQLDMGLTFLVPIHWPGSSSPTPISSSLGIPVAIRFRPPDRLLPVNTRSKNHLK